MNAVCETAFPVIELRRYAMKPGRRDELIALFEREFIESQEACGMCPIGHFVDLDDPDCYIWFRGFPGVTSRKPALEAFYDRSDAWLQNRNGANDTLVDSDNVLLLRPLSADRGFDLNGLRRPAAGEVVPESYVALSIFMLGAQPAQSAAIAFERNALPALEQIGTRRAVFVTEDAPNDYPRLPVREGEQALVVTGICSSLDGLQAWADCLKAAELPGDAEHIRLRPAERSLYR